MSWRGTQSASRERLLSLFDDAEVDAYDAVVGCVSDSDLDAWVADIRRVVPFHRGQSVLDAGAGTGALCQILTRIEGLAITALEPVPAMRTRFRNRSEFQHIDLVNGFCDHPDDRRHFTAERFDVIASRQLINGLFDPLAAFRNWRSWLKPEGVVVVIDGLYDRTAWTGRWEPEVDTIPLSACRSTAGIPYLLEQAGFRIEAVERMSAVNALASTRTPRFLVVARRASEN